MGAEKIGQAGIESIDLGKNKIAEPLNAYRVREGSFGVARFSPIRPFIVTLGISACKGLSFYREDEKLGLLAHISVANKPDKMIRGLVNEIGGSLKGVVVNLIMGAHQAANSEAKFIRGGKWPTIDELMAELNKYSPSYFKVDTHSSGYIKGLALNLANGEIKEIDGSKGLTWRDQQDTSLNRKLDDL